MGIVVETEHTKRKHNVTLGILNLLIHFESFHGKCFCVTQCILLTNHQLRINERIICKWLSMPYLFHTLCHDRFLRSNIRNGRSNGIYRFIL